MSLDAVGEVFTNDYESATSKLNFTQQGEMDLAKSKKLGSDDEPTISEKATLLIKLCQS